MKNSKWIVIPSDELYHHGIKGQKWGVRRFQNKDGTLTKEGKERYYVNIKDNSKFSLSSKQKKLIKIGVIAAGSALAIYGGYRLYKNYGRIQGFRTYGLNESLADHFKDYPDKDIVINSRTKLQRVSSDSFEDLANKGHIYCSYKFRDNQRYLSGFRKEINKSGNTDFVHKIKPKNDMKIASPRKAAIVYSNLNPRAKDNLFRFVMNPYAYNDKYYKDDRFIKYVSDERRRLVAKLQELGYSGVLDVEDASKHKNSAPVIIFRPADNVDVVNSRKIKDFETYIGDFLK